MQNIITFILLVVLSSFSPLTALAQGKNVNTSDKAFRIYERLACEPPTRDQLEKMIELIDAGKETEAAMIATDTRGFYECTVKNWCLAQTNEQKSKDVPLNDYCATVIGGVRDNLPFTDLLYKDIIYIAESTQLSPYSLKDNKLYEELQDSNASLVDLLVQKKQTEVTGFSTASGILTTRAFAKGFLSGGTNRLAVARTLENYLCTDMEKMMDTSLSDTFVGRDVERAPGGDPMEYQTKCKGCHTGMDGLRSAWAYFSFDDETKELVFNEGVVAKKYNINSSAYPDGFQTVDNKWRNLWVAGVNKNMGWPADKSSGTGIQEFGEMIAKTKTFSRCMAKRTFNSVCMADENSSAAKEIIDAMAIEFKSDNYNLKNLFAKTVSLCTGGE